MTRDNEDAILSLWILAMIILLVGAIMNATPTPETKKCECTEERR